MTVDLDLLRQWIGRQARESDLITPAPLRGLSATLDRHDECNEGQGIAPLWHWLYFLPTHRQSALGPDGHAHRGGFLPPVPLPRRMWAGSQLVFHRPLQVGHVAHRCSTIDDVQLKVGRTGPLVFVKVRHEITANGQQAIDEVHHIVYRDLPPPAPPAAPPFEPPAASAATAPGTALWVRTVVPDDVLLFRYSALTFNAHRIHYDRRYATGVEGYPGLVVHGPLMATWLLDLLREHQPQARVSAFEFKALHPVFDVAPFQLCGRPGPDGEVALWVLRPDGQVAMQASARVT